MKRGILIWLCFLWPAIGFSQKVAYVDLEYILKNIPEYQDAQKRIDDLTAQWQKEIDQKYAEIDRLYKQFQAEQVLLTEDIKAKRRQEIEEKEKAARELQKKRFGYQGDLFQKRQELVQPIQDRVYDAIQKTATARQYDFVMDKSAGTMLLYANSKLNISDQVLQTLGITPKAPKQESGTQQKQVPK
ncbi:MAG: OmpH family outer membrane protein [Chitinophagales bacterium]|nr:OmpH family outer membrane protein [Chitinophagales bacterium]MDW8394199.1 OmpH family outer membrane protein [Chitinophagales bacterium]